MLFNLRWACYGHHIVGSFYFFSIQPLWLLTWEFNLFADRGLLIGKNLLMQSYCFMAVLKFPHSFLPLLLPSFVDWWFFVVVCFDLLLFIFCESTVGFCLVATKRLNIKHLIERTVSYDYSHITDCIHKLPVYHPFNVFNNSPFFILHIHTHYYSYSYFSTLLSFKLYSRVKWLTHHQITGSEYSIWIDRILEYIRIEYSIQSILNLTIY